MCFTRMCFLSSNFIILTLVGNKTCYFKNTFTQPPNIGVLLVHFMSRSYLTLETYFYCNYVHHRLNNTPGVSQLLRQYVIAVVSAIDSLTRSEVEEVRSDLIPLLSLFIISGTHTTDSYSYCISTGPQRYIKFTGTMYSCMHSMLPGTIGHYWLKRPSVNLISVYELSLSVLASWRQLYVVRGEPARALHGWGFDWTLNQAHVGWGLLELACLRG